MALLLLVGLVSTSAFAQLITNGAMQTRTNSIPRGALWLTDHSAAGGHWWVSDNVFGVCQLVANPVAGAQPPLVFGPCTGTAKSGGQLVAGSIAPAIAATQPAGAQFLYVPDNASRTAQIVRFVYNPAGNGSLGTSTIMQVPNATNVGGGANGGRTVAAALLPHKGLAANGGTQDLYVGYLKSGDVGRIEGIDAIALNNQTPPFTIAGASSDGRGMNSLLAFGNDLYLGELGGFGVSKIADPSGITRTKCTSATSCTAQSLGPNPCFLPGGMATDWTPGTSTAGKAIFIGTAVLGGAPNPIVKYDPATTATVNYSVNVAPSYTAPDSSGVVQTWTTYVQPLGVGYRADTADMMVGDDPQGAAATPIFQQGHTWLVPHPANAVIPQVTGIAPNSGLSLGGDFVTVTGTDLATFDALTGVAKVLPTINFGPNAGTQVACSQPSVPPPPSPVPSTCTVFSPSSIGFGPVDVTVTLAGQTSPINPPADQFTYNPPATNAVTITTISPNTGATIGATVVTITGANLATFDALGNVLTQATFSFGVNAATNVSCTSATSCVATSPAAAAGTVAVNATIIDAQGVTQVSPLVPGDLFTYITPSATLYAWGITAPKGGAIWIPGALGGHWWSSDHAQGFCRQDLFATPGNPFISAASTSTLHALNFSTCASDLVGSAGQAAYDSRLVVNLATGLATTFHYVYVPDNAVKSTAIWRLTFDPATELMVADPNGGALATAMVPLSDLRTLKPNGLALGPDGNLYVSDLVEPNIRQVTNPNGDPRTQAVLIVAKTGDGRGANGTIGFIGNLLYISGNRATQFFDITLCPIGGVTACGMASVPAPTAIFVAGTAVDAPHKLVYLSNSPGGGNANILRYNASKDVYVPFPAGSVTPDAFGVVTCPACTTGDIALNYIGGGLLPPPGTGNGIVTAATSLVRPWDQAFHPTAGLPAGSFVQTGFGFVFGLGMDPTGALAITEDPTAGNRSGRGTMWTVPYIP